MRYDEHFISGAYLAAREMQKENKMKYPMISKLGLFIDEAGMLNKDYKVIGADDLEKVLEQAQVLYGYPNSSTLMQSNVKVNGEWPDKKAKIIMIEKIKKGVTKSEIRSMIAEDPEDDCRMITLLKRIEKEGIVD